MNRFVCTAAAVLALIAGAAQGAVVNVGAQANSSSGGTGLNTGISLTGGQLFTVTVAPTDLWNAGPLPRWSDANGLDGNLLATGIDESGQPVNTLIGQNFGLWTQSGLSAPYGALVGELNNVFFFVGTNFSGAAPGVGTDTLTLYYWDSNNVDNTQSISADIRVPAAVPEPGSLALLSLALLAGAGLRRQRKLVRE